MSTVTPRIDLSQLPPPAVVETLSFDAILASILADLEERVPGYVVSEADPAYKILEVCGYRELLLRQRINDAAVAVMLPYATGADLDNLAALLDVRRQLLTPADATAIPPLAAVYETDARLRTRAQLALSAVSTAGPASSYKFHTLSADARVIDAAVDSPAAGSVTVTVLSSEGNGMATADLLAAVSAALSEESVRPMGDVLLVQSAAIVEYEVTAVLTIGAGPDAATVLAVARAAVTAYVESARRIGIEVPLSGIYAALHQSGVLAVALTSPAAAVGVSDVQASFCTAVTVTAA